MHFPSATYRIQLNKDFTFKDLLNIIDYLHALGISTIYAAPILKSTKGSAHGYDVVDPHMIDPEIGTISELQAIATKLSEKKMTWIQDIVPNHMAFDGLNTRLMDVLERGPASTYYNYFDIQWNHPSHALRNRIMVPFLGDELDRCVNQEQIKLTLGAGGFQVMYFENRYPVSAEVYDFILSFNESQSVHAVRQRWNNLIKSSIYSGDCRTWQEAKTNWIESISGDLRDQIEHTLGVVNANTKVLTEVLERQHYVLTHWKRTEKEINYRRFFTVNQLICIRVEDENVFQDYHSFLLSLYQQNLIQGFRIDHIDGLKDPAQYIKNLRELFGHDCYIIAEKILESKEMMPNWPIQGTSGYEFLAHVNQLFTDKKGAKQLLEFYKTLVPDLPAYKQLVVKNKKLILENYMGGEWDNLVNYFMELKLGGSFSFKELKEALGLVMVSLPVYRIYPDRYPLSQNDLDLMKETFANARKMDAGASEALEYLYRLFVAPGIEQEDDLELPAVIAKAKDAKTESQVKANVLSFLKRLMQFTGPLTAKGVEDTTFYIYNPLISHDEVGDSPSTLGITINQFHKRMISRQQQTPLSLNATATHDTKRGEDVRIRLNVLSEIPASWQRHVMQWRALNKSFLEQTGKQISVNDEYFIYQSVVGGMPEDLVVTEEWKKRLQEYLIKVVREAKVNSNWESPNAEYEQMCSQFIAYLLSDESVFLANLMPFVRHLLQVSNTYSVGQALIKMTAPGVPDIYQGCELWDLSYVDPDNRRAVDYGVRKRLFDEMLQNERAGNDELFSFLKENRNIGVEKLFVTWKTLTFRRNYESVFSQGSYIPLEVTGGKQIACVYARNNRDAWIIVAVPFGLTNEKEKNLDLDEEESIVMLEQFPSRWINVFTGDAVTTNGYIPLKAMFGKFPVALLYSI